LLSSAWIISSHPAGDADYVKLVRLRGCTVRELDDQLQVSFSITVSPEVFTAARESDDCAHAVVTFAYDDDAVRCDGEIILRLKIKR
jgi:hypothetical protein